VFIVRGESGLDKANSAPQYPLPLGFQCLGKVQLSSEEKSQRPYPFLQNTIMWSSISSVKSMLKLNMFIYFSFN
jgi:hypothetical protein